jgi:hypothetical protein
MKATLGRAIAGVALAWLSACATPAASPAAPAPAPGSPALASSLKYCMQLVAMFDRYVIDDTERSIQNATDLPAHVGAAQCRQGNPAGIPALETALRNGGFTLPPRT